MTSPEAAADAVVAAVDPGLSSPGVERRNAVLVTGPWLAGTTALVDALRERLPDVTFVETGELSVIEAPIAVVFVVSAAARLTESDCALLDVAAANTDLVIGVVSKIDAHRNWRDVLAADRQALIIATTQGWAAVAPLTTGHLGFTLRRYDAAGAQDPDHGDWLIDVIEAE